MIESNIYFYVSTTFQPSKSSSVLVQRPNVLIGTTIIRPEDIGYR
jgi:hypothetical protein